MQGVHRDLKRVADEMEAINLAMIANSHPVQGGIDKKFIENYSKNLQKLSSGFRDAINASGAFDLRNAQVASHASKLTEAIQAQKFGLRDLVREHKHLGDVYREQMALQKSMVMQWGRTPSGKTDASLITPRSASVAKNAFSDLISKAGFYNQVLGSVADQTIKWGKNTQWAGRQLTAGLSVPIVAATAGMGMLAYELDKGLTQVVKVYGDAATAATVTDKQIRDATMHSARAMASAFGQSAKDTIEITSELAATGKVGNELMDSTAQVTRARTLGELNLQDAMKATITLQSTYQMNSQKLGETFDFMNSMENQTSLTMQDFVVGIPMPVGVLKEFGGTVQDAGVLLAGMKAAGIDAAEGANAIKSIAFKVIAPNQGSQDLFKQLTGASFQDTMKGTDGVIGRLVKLGEAVKDLPQSDRVGLIQKMFGLYQGSKTLSLLDQLTSGSEQMSRAFEVANGSTAEWAATAGRELDKLTNSKWNKLKQQWETLRLQLAEIGQTALEMATPVLKFFTDLVTKINGMDPATKKMLLWGAALTAAFGPIIMLAGLAGNLIGNVGKLTTSINGLFLRFRFQNAEQVMADRLAKQVAEGTISEANAMKYLVTQIDQVTAALTRMNINQQLASSGLVLHPKTGMPVRQKTRTNAQGQTVKAGYAAPTKAQAAAAAAIQQSMAGAAASSVVAESRWAALKLHGAAFAGSLAFGASALASMVTPSGSMANNIANAAMAASLIAPMMWKVVAGTKAAQKFIAFWKADFAIAAAQGKQLAGWLGPKLMAALPVVGTIGAIAAAAGAVWWVINKNVKEARKNYDEFNNSAETMSKVLGFTYTEAAKGAENATTQTQKLTDAVKKLRDMDNGVIKEYDKMRDKSTQEQMDFAINEAAKARLHGATKEQAEEVARVALQAMNSTIQSSAVSGEIAMKIDLTNLNEVGNFVTGKLSETISKAASQGFEQGWGENVMRFFASDSGELNQAASSAIKGRMKDAWAVYANTPEAEKQNAFKRIRDEVMSGQESVFNELRRNPEYAKLFERFGIDSSQKLADNMDKVSLFMHKDDYNKFVAAMNAAREATADFMHLAGVDPKIIEDNMDKLFNFDAVKSYSNAVRDAGKDMLTTTDAQAQWNSYLAESKTVVGGVTKEEQLNWLNMLRRKAGLKEVTSVEIGFSDAIENSGEVLQTQAEKAKSSMDAMKGIADAMNSMNGKTFDPHMDFASAEQATSFIRNSYEGAMNTVYDEAARIMDNQYQATLDGIQKQATAAGDALDKQQQKMEDKFDAQDKAFETRWDNKMKSIKNYYEGRIDAADRAIEAERKADDERQKIFEAEKTRMERLAALYNRNVDINMAINSGNLDQAAKLTTEGMAQDQTWQTEDANNAAKEKSDARIAALEAEKKRIQDSQKLAEELADTQKKNEQESLKATQEAEKRKFEARKKASDAYYKDLSDKTRKEQEEHKRMLDAELARIKLTLPSTQAELNAHIGKVEAAYDKYGKVVITKGTGWGNTVGNALKLSTMAAGTAIENDIKWDKIGQSVANAMSSGAFGMDIGEFMKWVMTGEVPSGWTPPKDNPLAAGKSAQVDKQRGIMTGRHSGGIIDDSKGSRTGFSGTNQSQSEVWVNALKGEAVLNRKATRMVGADFIDLANKGIMPPNIGGPDLGFGGLMGAMMAGMLKRAVNNGIIQRGMIREQMDAAMSGAGYNGPPLTGFEAFFQAISAQESGGNYSAVNGSSGALGKYQIMPSNVGPWGKQYLGKNITPAQFLSTPALQDQLARAVLGSYFARYGARGAAAKWYSGDASLSESTAKQGNYPSIKEYVDSIMAKMNSYGGVMAADGTWTRPAVGPRTSPFGWRIHPITGKRTFHKGSDIGAAYGSPIRAARGGRVVATVPTEMSGGYGNYTIIDHGGGIRTTYAHQSRFGVREGQSVMGGQVIGFVGSTGNSTGPHLHFQYERGGVPMNPGLIIPGLKKGGFTMSDGMAMLHKKEAVLTAPLTESLKKGITKMETNDFGGNTYQFDFSNSNFGNNSIGDIKGAVKTAIMEINKERGLDRKVTPKSRD
jgi:TP901 family phage tail tape measure protein